MTLLSLKYFVVLAEYLSFTKAAECFRVSQSTVSRQIADLEEEFGVQLFSREKRTISLTRAGEICLTEAKKIIADCDKLAQRLKKATEDVSGTLKIGYFPSLSQPLFVAPLQRMMTRYSNVNVEFAKAMFPELQRLLMDGEVDLIYTSVAGMGNQPDISITRIAKK